MAQQATPPHSPEAIERDFVVGLSAFSYESQSEITHCRVAWAIQMDRDCPNHPMLQDYLNSNNAIRGLDCEWLWSVGVCGWMLWGLPAFFLFFAGDFASVSGLEFLRSLMGTPGAGRLSAFFLLV